MPCSLQFTPNEVVGGVGSPWTFPRRVGPCCPRKSFCGDAFQWNYVQIQATPNWSPGTQNRILSPFKESLQRYVSVSTLYWSMSSRNPCETLQNQWVCSSFTREPESCPSSYTVIWSHQIVGSFISNYAESNAMQTPGRMPGYKRDGLKLLPSSETKASIWRQFKTACEEQNTEPVSLVAFRRLWQQFLPDVVMLRPATDLCWVCQQNSTVLGQFCNLSEEQKSEKLEAVQKHLFKARGERSYYKKRYQESEEVIKKFLIQSLSRNVPLLVKGMVHYSFDMEQQVHFPYNPQQPGPIFFKTQRKFGVFGVYCEAIPQQIIYLIDEAVTTGKSANCIISLLHHFFESYDVGEDEVWSPPCR